MDVSTANGVGPRAGRREWIGLAVLALPSLHHLERIVGWALVEFEDTDSERQTRIVGLSLFSSGVWFADNTKEFFEYVHEDQLTQRHERFRSQGRKYADDPEGHGS